jgi:hypothetical protein
MSWKGPEKHIFPFIESRYLERTHEITCNEIQQFHRLVGGQEMVSPRAFCNHAYQALDVPFRDVIRQLGLETRADGLEGMVVGVETDKEKDS